MMQRYVLTGKEEQILSQLKNGKPVMIIGLPASGKSALARYIAIQFIKEDNLPIILAPRQYYEQPDFVYAVDEEGHEFYIPRIPIGGLSEDKKSLIVQIMQLSYSASFLKNVLDTVSEISDKGTYIEAIAKSVEEILEKIGITKEILKNVTKNLREHISRFIKKESVENIKKLTPAIIAGLAIFESISIISPLLHVTRMFYEQYQEYRIKSESSRFLLIIDDYADFPHYERNILDQVLYEVSHLESKVLIIYRISPEDLITDGNKFQLNPPEYTKKILGGHKLFEESRQIVYIEPVIDPIHFQKILEANGLEITPAHIDILEDLITISAGLPGMAIMLAKLLSNGGSLDRARDEIHEYIKNLQEKHGYKPMDEIIQNPKQIVFNLRYLHDANEYIYLSLRKRNFMIIPLLLTKIRSEYLKKIYNKLKKGDPLLSLEKDVITVRHVNIGGYNVFHQVYQKRYEDNLYEINELWAHLRVFLPILTKNNKEIKDEITTVINTILETYHEDIEYSEIELFSTFDLIKFSYKTGISLNPKLLIQSGIRIFNSQSPIMYEASRYIFSIITKNLKLFLTNSSYQLKIKLMALLWQYSEGMTLNIYVLENDHIVMNTAREIIKRIGEDKEAMFMYNQIRANYLSKQLSLYPSHVNKTILIEKILQEINDIEQTLRFFGDSLFEKYATALIRIRLAEAFIFSGIPLENAFLHAQRLLLRANRLLEEIKEDILRHSKDNTLLEFFSKVFFINPKKYNREVSELILKLRILGDLRLAYYYLALSSWRLNQIGDAKEYIRKSIEYAKKESEVSGSYLAHWILSENLKHRIEITTNGLTSKIIQKIIESSMVVKGYLTLLPIETQMTILAEIVFIKHYVSDILQKDILKYIPGDNKEIIFENLEFIENHFKTIFPQHYRRIFEYIEVIKAIQTNTPTRIKINATTINDEMLKVVITPPTREKLYKLNDQIKFVRDNLLKHLLSNILKYHEKQNKEGLIKSTIQLFFIEY